MMPQRVGGGLTPPSFHAMVRTDQYNKVLVALSLVDYFSLSLLASFNIARINSPNG